MVWGKNGKARLKNSKKTQPGSLLRPTSVMKDKSKNPHDRFTRDLFSNLSLARELFRISLPDKILQNSDLQGLSLEHGIFFDDELAESITDLLFKVPCLGPESPDAYILVEHKSTPDYQTPAQVQGYLILIYEKTGYESPVICYVFHNGKKAWSFLSRLNDGFKKCEDGLQKYLPFQNIVPFDLSDQDLDILEISLTLRACLYTLKHIRGPDFRERLPGLFDILRNISDNSINEHNRKVLERLLIYIYQCSDINIKEYKEYIKASERKAVEKIMITTYEQILQEGRQEGKQEGIREKELEVARKALENGFTLEDIQKLTGLSRADLIHAGVLET